MSEENVPSEVIDQPTREIQEITCSGGIVINVGALNGSRRSNRDGER